jgi:hypothetical protein
MAASKSSLAIGLTQAQQAESVGTGPSPEALSEHAAQVEPVRHLENEYLSFTLFSDGTAKIVDRKTQTEWRMGPVAMQDESPIDVGHVWVRTGRSVCEQYPGRFLVKIEGDTLRYWLLGRGKEIKGSFLVQITLEGKWLEFRLVAIDHKLPSLVFPPPIECNSLVLPMNVGRWIREPLEGRYFYPFFSNLNMRWFGGLREDKGWLALFPEENFVDSGAMVTELSSSPAWLQSLGQWSQPRVVRYTFAAGDYVRLAKIYREWAIEHGLHKSLVKKIAATPALINLCQGRMISLVEAHPRHAKEYDDDILMSAADDDMLGHGPKVHFTHQQVREVIRDLPSIGIRRALINVRGWIPGGYDYSHPDVWPPEPDLGPLGDLKSLCGTGDPYTVVLHDNYQDIYRQSASWPKGVDHRADGSLLPGGYWAGGQAYILNSRDSVRYAQRNWREMKQLSLRGLYVDTTTACQAYQSFEPNNSLTRSQDVEYKTKLLAFFKSQGLVLGSEEGADFGVPHLDWFENRHDRVPGESVPLWPLVFHDAALCGRYTKDTELGPVDRRRSEEAAKPPSWLLDLLWGYFIISGCPDRASWDLYKERLKSTLQVDEWLRKVSLAEMVSHRFVASDFQVEETSFSTGDTIVVNFSSEERNVEGVRIPRYGYQMSRRS